MAARKRNMTRPQTRQTPGSIASWGGGEPPQVSRRDYFDTIGNTGLRQYSGWVREEFLPQLAGRQAARVYREMQDNSDVVGAIMFAILGIMRKVEWRVDPANDSAEAEKMAEFADGLRDDMSDTWEDFVVECLSMLGYGFAVHEIVYKRRLGPAPHRRNGPYPGFERAGSKFNDGLIGIRRLPIRGQDTILKWFFGGAGEVLGVTQQPYVGPMIDLPIEKLLLFRPLSHKGNPEGRSILRTAYRKYYFIKRLEEQEAVLFERLSGLPVVKVPNAVLEGASSGDPLSVAALQAYKNLVANVRIDEQMGLILPSDTWPGVNGPTPVPMYDFKLETPQGGRANLDANTPIIRHTQGLLTSVLADFIQMGHTSRGAQNLAETKVDLFMQAVEGWLNSVASVLNRFLLPRVWELNGFDDNLLPEYRPDMAQRIDLEPLSKYFFNLAQSGMPLFPDKDLEGWFRDVAGAPARSEDGDSAEAAAAEAAALLRSGGAVPPKDNSGGGSDNEDNSSGNGGS
jgi:hypothetical protein